MKKVPPCIHGRRAVACVPCFVAAHPEIGPEALPEWLRPKATVNSGLESIQWSAKPQWETYRPESYARVWSDLAAQVARQVDLAILGTRQTVNVARAAPSEPVPAAPDWLDMMLATPLPKEPEREKPCRCLFCRLAAAED